MRARKLANSSSQTGDAAWTARIAETVSQIFFQQAEPSRESYLTISATAVERLTGCAKPTNVAECRFRDANCPLQCDGGIIYGASTKARDAARGV